MEREGSARRSRVRGRPRPGIALVTGFLLLIAVGTGLLVLPMSSASGAWTAPVTALFTSVSAVCVTGLVVVDTGTYWSPFGQVVVLALIKLGGLGFMSFSTLLLLFVVGRGSALHSRIEAQETLGVRDLGSVRQVLRLVIVFTVACEAVGWAVLGLAFLARFGDPVKAAWFGLFHAVSSFNNAGFDLMGGFHSFTGFAGDPFVLVPIGLLVLLGGLGAAIVGDLVAKRRWGRLALETKLVLATSGVLLAIGTLLPLAFEAGNAATFGGMPPGQALLNAAFQSVTYRTAGISSVPIGQLTDPTLLVGMALMFVGGASGSTAGGIKVTTVAILVAAVLATVRGRSFTEAFGRRVPEIVVFRALAVAMLSAVVVFGVVLALEVTAGSARFLALAFEAVSAFATVGHSTDLTPTLPQGALLILAATMFIGRLGPLTLVLALAARARPVPYRPAVESVRIG
jgi:trk system potassium uptake protein TrkH